MTAPFEDREGWEMNALALDGSVYLEQYEDRDSAQNSYKWVPSLCDWAPANDRAKDNAQWALQGYMGYAYEAYATLPQAEEGPEGWSGTVNTNVQVSSHSSCDLTAVVQVSPVPPSPSLLCCTEGG